MYNLYKMLYIMKHTLDRFKIFGIGKIGPKGQVVIPAEAREELDFKPGEKVVVAGMPSKNSLIIMNYETFEQHMEHMRRYHDVLGDILKYQTDRPRD